MRRSLLAGTVIALVACGSTTTSSTTLPHVSAATSNTPEVTSAARGGSSTAEVTSTVPAGTSTTNAFPVTIGSVTITSRPTRVVSLSPTATEMLFAMGAGPQVVAVDDQSNYPANLPPNKLSGLQPNVEAIAAINPDLVVISYDPNGLAKGLTALKIPVLAEPAAASLDDSYSQIEQLGAATGNGAGAADEVATMKSRIATLVGSVHTRPTPLRYYYELDNTYYSVTAKTFIGALYSLAGLVDIADAADTQGSGYPQLSAEYIIKANPDLIFLADTKCCQQNATTVAARPGWATLTAVHDNEVVALDDDVASRWGPRTPDLLAAIVAALTKLP